MHVYVHTDRHTCTHRHTHIHTQLVFSTQLNDDGPKKAENINRVTKAFDLSPKIRWDANGKS